MPRMARGLDRSIRSKLDRKLRQSVHNPRSLRLQHRLLERPILKESPTLLVTRASLHIGGLDWLNIPIGAFLMPIKLLTVVVQALIFCLLTCVYLGMVTGGDHGEEHGHGEPAPAH